jgi:MFS family permease
MAAGFNAYLIAPASIIPILTVEFAIGKAAAGLAISVFFLAWMVAGLPGGLLMDRYDNRRLVAVGVVAFVLASWGGAAAPSYELFLVTRFVGGATGAFIWTANTNVVNQVFPEHRRAVGTSLFVASGPAGQALAQFGGPLVAEAAGWRTVFVAYPLIAVVGLVGLFVVLRRPIRSESRISLGEFAGALRNPAVLSVGMASACAFSLFVFFSSWMPTYATEVLSIELAAAGAATALVPFTGIVSRPGGGWLSDKLGGRRRPVVVASFVLSLPVILGISFVATPDGFAALLAMAGLSSQLGIGVVFVLVSELADEGTEGTSLAVLTTVSTFGSLVAPVAAGWLIQQFSWTVGYGFAVCLALAGIASILRAPEPT